MASKIIMLGVGNAFATRCYNTCFIINDGTTMLLVDAGGGNGILRQVEDAGISFADIHDMFVTHCHTDHIIGAVWAIRKTIQLAKSGYSNARLTIHGHDKAISTVKALCELTLATKDKKIASEIITMHRIDDGETFTAGSIKLECFDIHSSKEKQFGFKATLPSGTTIACLGDEPFNELNRATVQGSDWLMHEAFCLYSDREKFKPYEKHHSTALDAGRNAKSLNVKNLIIYHTEDKAMSTRKASYMAEAAKAFDGRIFVPDDLETIVI